MAKLTLAFRDIPQRTFDLEGTDILIGRDDDCAVYIDNLAIHPRHAKIHYEDGRYVISAIGETETLNINETSEKEHALNDGDILQLGKYTLTYTGYDIPDEYNRGSGSACCAWLSTLNGNHAGRRIYLEGEITRIGRPGIGIAAVITRPDGHYLSHLEGMEKPVLNQSGIGEEEIRLEDGNTIYIGGISLQYHIETLPAKNSIPGTRASAGTEPQRRFTRILYHADVSLSRDSRQWNSKLLDLSLSGALVERPKGWHGKVGNWLRLDIYQQGNASFHMDTRIAHIGRKILGLSCEHIDDESIAKLRWLIEINLGDPQLLERELSVLGRERRTVKELIGNEKPVRINAVK